MSFQLKLIQNYFKLISVISPTIAARQGIKVFSKVRLKGTKTKELEFYTLSDEFKVPFSGHKDLKCYETGNPKGKLIFLIHGWDSNIGSLTLFAKGLIETNNYRIIGVSLPAHGYHEEDRTNMVESSNAFKAILDYLKPEEPFDIISHSFGSGVSTIGLEISGHKADKIIFLTTPNKVINIFEEFRVFVKMGEKTYRKMLKIAQEEILNENVEDFTISKKLHKAQYNQLLIIHDEFDKILPFKNTEEILEEHPEVHLHKMKKIGHYRMLWNPKVVSYTLQFLKEEY